MPRIPNNGLNAQEWQKNPGRMRHNEKWPVIGREAGRIGAADWPLCGWKQEAGSVALSSG